MLWLINLCVSLEKKKKKEKLPRCDLIDSLSKEHLAQTKLDYFYELVSPGISGGCALLLWQ